MGGGPASAPTAAGVGEQAPTPRAAPVVSDGVEGGAEQLAASALASVAAQHCALGGVAAVAYTDVPHQHTRGAEARKATAAIAS